MELPPAPILLIVVCRAFHIVEALLDPQGWEVDIIMTNATTLGAVTVISGGAGWTANETVTIPSALIGGGGNVVLTAATVTQQVQVFIEV